MKQSEVNKILESLFKRRTLGIKPGLERMKHACVRLGNPQNSYSVIHTAGTNGKGSTSTFVASILKECGQNVGLFTSPHIWEFRERFQINGNVVSNDAWIEVWLEIEPLCDELELTFFEISALIAFVLFEKAGCSYSVIEVGLGGRLDATNVVTPEVSIITPISIDHTEYLGSTLEQIATEKLGIVKAGGAVVVNGDNGEIVVNLAKEISKKHGSKITFSDITKAQIYSRAIEKQHFLYKDSEYRLSLAGEFQVSNAIVAIEVANILGIAEKNIKLGLEKAKIAGRVQELIYEGKRVFLDVAHNPMAMETLSQSLVDYNGKIIVVFGMMADKDVEKSVKVLSEMSRLVVTVTPSIPRALVSGSLAEIVKRFCEHEVKVEDTVSEGVASALDEVGDDEIIVVCGSFYTVSEALSYLKFS
jgi:dihydrofolate synthase/folylpolyglutamate synthase